MTKLKTLVFLLIASVCFFSACKDGGVLTSTNDTVTSIPSDASMVTKVDVKSIMDKMDFEAVQKMEFYQEIVKEAREDSEIAAKILEDPTVSGIDLDKNIYMAYDVDPKVIGNVFTYASFSVKDAAAFETLLKEAGMGNFETKEGYQIAKKGRKQIAAWSDKMGIVGASMSNMNTEDAVAKIFSTGKENSIATNAEFKKSLEGNHDITSWFTSNAVADNPDAKMAVGFMNIKPEALKDNFTNSYVDFKDGEIVSKSKFKINENLSRDLNLFFKDNPETNFGKYVPGENMGFGMTAALDFNGINQVLSERPQVKSFANFALKEYGLDIDQVFKALGGDIMVSGYVDEANQLENGGLFATNIGDRKEFDTILAAAEEFGFLVKEGDYYTAKVPGAPIPRGARLLIKKDMIFISATPSLLEKINDGSFKSSDLSKKMKSVSSDNIFSLVTDFEVLKDGVNELSEFGGRSIEMTTNRKNADFKMEFDDKKTNSLKQLMKMLNEAYKKSEREKGRSI